MKVTNAAVMVPVAIVEAEEVAVGAVAVLAIL